MAGQDGSFAPKPPLEAADDGAAGDPKPRPRKKAKPRTPSLEQSARNALLGGACLLVLGIGLVGVGATVLGTLPALAGLTLTIAAIHFYGRLGPDESSASDRDERREAARGRILRGALILLVSLAVAAGTRSDGGERNLVLAVALVWGLSEVVRGWKVPTPVKPAKARVEKRRRMDKSPAP